MRAVTILLLLSLVGCFPHDARHRRYARLGEGAAIASGIALLAVAPTGADCSSGPAQRDAYDDCRRNTTIVGNLGLGLILAGLVGFAVTTITAKDAAPEPRPLPIASDDPSDEPTPKPPIRTLRPAP